MTRAVLLAVRHWRWTLGVWVVAVAVSAVFAPDFTQVATYDENAFLPSGAASLRGGALVQQGWPGDNFTRSGVVVLLREDGPLSRADTAYAADLAAWLRSDEAPDGLGRVTSHLDEPELADALLSEDRHAMLLIAGFDVPPFSPLGHEVVRAMRGHIARTPPPDGLDALVTGAAGIALDEHDAIEASVARTELLTVALVVLLVLWVLRSPVAALVPLITVGAAYAVAMAVVGSLARLGMDVSYLFQMFAIVIIFGAGTDYALLILARYAEAPRGPGASGAPGASDASGVAGRERRLFATMAVLTGVLVSTAAATMVGFSSQVVAQFGLFRTMGPALAISVFITLQAGITLTPAVMRLFGRWLFWPGDLVTGRGVRAGHGGASPVAELEPGEPA